METILIIWAIAGLVPHAITIDRHVSWKYDAVMWILFGPACWLMGLVVLLAMGICSFSHWLEQVTKDKAGE